MRPLPLKSGFKTLPILFIVMVIPYISPAQYALQRSKLIGTGASGIAQQGNAVSISADGTTLAVGGIDDSSFVGAVWVYTLSGTNWIQVGGKLVGSDASQGDIGSFIGFSVSLSADGKTLAVGGYQDNSGDGAAWVYTFSGGNWKQMGNKLVGTGAVCGTNGAYQGSSVSLSANGQILAVGGLNDNSGVGAVWVYTLSGTNWVQIGNKLGASDAQGSAYLGTSVSISSNGTTLAAG